MIMILTSTPVHLLAAEVNYNNLSYNKSKIINNKTPVKVAKLETGNTAADLIKNPDQPAIYTLRTDYKVQRGEKYRVDYQPYIASVGEAATQAEKDKVNKPIDLPDIAGYKKPQKDFTIDYKTIKDAADGKNEPGNDDNGLRYSVNKEFNYSAISNEIKIKHVFQKLDDFTKYTNPDGSVGDEGALITTQNGNTGSTMQVSPLSESDSRRKGFVPEADYINLQVPQNAENFVLEYRYNRAHYDVVFDTAGGTPIPTRTLYYEQAMPKIADADIPTKVGGEFQGWKPSVDLKTKDEKTYKANEIIKVGTNEASKNLDANLIMPASKVTFTAVWKDNEKADYAIQFWAEKSDHADDASLLDKYDYIGTRVYKDKDTGMRPDLNNEPVKDIVFPDLDKARLNKIWNGETFNRRKNKLLDKFFVYNQALTHDQNKDPANVNLVKSVDSTGKTVYNIYYDRQVYDLYFTKSNAQPDKNTFYPEIWGYDEAQGEAVMKGGPGNLYHYKARFNEMMYKWPNDAKQTKGFTPGYQSFGWGPNYTVPNWPLHLDTPPYRLNADEFLDMANYTNWGGYTKKIDKGDGTTMDLDPLDFKTLSFGIKQDNPSIPHHMDFWMDGFKEGETIIRYDLVRTKADTGALGYGHRYPRVQGFTPYGYNPRSAWPAIAEGSEQDGRVDKERINDLNDERDEITPNTCGTYYNNYGTKLPIGQLDFIPVFFSDSDEFGDVKEGGQAFEENGYLRYKYKRNKYPLRFNYDPSKIKDDSEFNSTNQLDTFYEFPLKALSPDLEGNEEYKKENPKNLLDNPEKLQELGLKDLVFTDPKDGKLKVKRPDNLSDQMVFKGWALDPAGSKLVWENPKETMPFHPVNLYAKWGEPDYKWKVTFDPNGGSLRNIKEENLTISRKKIQEGDIGQEEINTYAKKEANEGDKQIFTVIQRQKLVEPKYKPTRKGYDFMGWEVIRYKKNAQGDYTDEIDNSYRNTYKVPELYSFGNDVVAPVYLKAIWTPNNRIDVKVVHHILNLDLSKETKKITETLPSKRAGNLVATSGDKQNEKYILATHKDLEEKLTGDLKKLYEDYNARVKANNTFFQTFKVEPEKIPDPKDSSKTIDNPKATDNVFHFFYRPFRTRDYKVNYIDERGKAEVEKFFKGLNLTDTSGLKDDALLKANEGNKKKFETKRTDFEKLIKEYKIVDPEAVSNGNRHYDARNYRQIPGWVLAKDEKPQQQLFFDVNEKTNEFLGINGTGADQVFFYYKDVRVIETKKDDPVPDGYVRVTYKADKGGAFTDKDGKEVTELHYDVIKGLQSQLLPVPQEWIGGKNDDGSEKQKEEGKYYITPETGKKFIKWDKSPLLNDNTIIKRDYTFTAYFEWSGLSASGLVRTEAFKDSSGKWTNDFAPKIADLKKQLVWREKDQVKDLPAGTKIQLFDEAGNELAKDNQVYDLVNEKGKADKDELFRTVNVKAKVTFTDGKDPQELVIPITVYKNVYEALTAGDKPLFLKEAEEKKAEKGGLSDVTGNYVKVTVNPTNKPGNKDSKIYYVNKNAWVNIPEVDISKDAKELGFTSWSADKDAQNENGVFDFNKRHKFTEDTIITPGFTKDVVEQTDPNKKPDVPDDYVKAIVKTTDKAVTEFTKTFWVNPTKTVTIPVVKPVGKTVDKTATEAAKAWTFTKWQSTEQSPKTWTNEIKGQFTEKETTIIAQYDDVDNIIPYDPSKTDPMPRPEGYVRVSFAADDGLSLTEQKAYYVKKNAGIKLGNSELIKPGHKEETGYKFEKWDKEDTLEIKEDDVLVTAKAKVLPDFDTVKHTGYVKVTFKAGANGVIKENGNTIDEKVYYVNPTKYVNLTAPTPEGKTGYDFSTWKSDKSQSDFSLANFVNYKEDTTITAMFNQKDAVYPKLDGSTKPAGYVEVTFKVTGTGGKIADSEMKTYYVDPTRQVSLKAPKTVAGTGFIFDKWRLGTNPTDQVINPADQKQYTVNTTIYGSFVKLKDIIPATNDDGTPNLQPIDYVAVLFIGGDHANKVDGNAIFYVNPKAGKKLKDLDTKGITVVPSPTYKHDGWDTDFETVIDKDTKVTAKYTQLPNIIKAGPKDTAPDGYVVIIFETDGRGTITGNAAYEKTPPASKENEIVYFVNPKKNIKLANLKAGSSPSADQLAVPSTTPNDPDKYTFDQWRTDIDTKTPITRGRVHIAMFKPKEVKLTYDKNGADVTGEVPPVLTVDYDADVRLAGKGNLAKKDSSFKGWKIGDKIYQAGEQINLKEDTTAYAQWTNDQNIIPYDPVNNPSTRPDDTYVRVTFAAEDGLKLKEQKAYYVKKDAGIKLGNTNLAKPGYTVETGYKFDKWDKEDSLEITTDILVTAKSTKLGTVIPEKDKNGNTNDKPEGYKEVVFKVKDEDQSKGSITGVAKFYVNPTEYVTINPPVTKAVTGYEFGAWDKDATIPTVYKKDATITGFFNGLKDVMPKTKNDGSDKPAGYKTVTFVIDPATGGKIADKEVTVYYVNPAKDVTVPQPKTAADTGYEFEKWDQDTTTAKKYKADTTVKGNFKKLDDIIPSTDNTGQANVKPEGYVTVTFAAETGLSLTESKVYYVKANAKVKLSEIKSDKTKYGYPKYKEETGYNFDKWDKDDLEIKDADIVVTAKATKLDKVIPEKDGEGNPNKNPAGYKEVIFVAAENGKIEGVTKFYVNPTEYVTINPPTAKGNTGFEFGGWSQNAEIPTQYTEKITTITASFNPVDSVIPKTKDDQQKPDGYVTVNFVIKGEGGQIVEGEIITYFVNPNEEVTIPQPKTKAEIGYEFEAWDTDTTTKAKYETDTTVTGSFKKLDDIIPSTDENGKPNAKPEGYVTVTFDKGANGNLTGQTVYYVNPKAGKTLANITKKPTVSPETGYNADGWDKKDIQPITGDLTVTAKYETIADVIPKTKDDDSEKPAGYIKVTFDTTEKGKIKSSTSKTKVVFTNPNKAVVLKGFAPEVVANKGYEFERWDTSIEKAIQYKNGDAIKAIYKDETTPDQPGGQPGEVEKHGHRYIERVAGKDRVHTAINTSRRFFNKSRYVIIADSGNYPDALTATVLAHVLDAPILLNNTRYLEDDVAREIVRLGASEVIIVGGNKSISENVKSQLARYDQNSVQRICGRDRYVTSSELAYEIQRLTGKVNKAIIASGENFPDALATAPLGSKEIAPILLVRRNQMDKKVDKALRDLNIKRVYVAGGPNSVSKELEEQLPQVIRRFNGRDRYETAVLVASYTYPESKEVFVASGEVFPDALVIGPVCARRKAPILLSRTTPVKVTDDYIEKSNIEYLYIIGGTNTIYAETAHKYAIED